MRRARVALLSFLVATAALALPGGAAHAIDPPKVRVTPGVSSVVLGSTRQLTATVTNLENTAVTWSVRSGPGTVDATGVYTPPATNPAHPFAVVRATSVEDAGLYGEATVAVASGVPAGGLAPKTAVSGGGLDAAVGDLNGDGRADLLRLQHSGGSLQIARVAALLSDGAGGFTTTTSGYVYFGTNIWDYYGDVVLGDFDSDGDLDAYAAVEAVTTSFNEYVMFTNNGSGTFTAGPVTKAEAGEGRAGARAAGTDFDGDGRLDVVRLDRFGTVTVHRGLGNGGFAVATALGGTSGGSTLAVGDLTGDGRPEAVVGTTSAAYFTATAFDVYVNDGFGALAGQTTYTAGLNPRPAVYDADGDGWQDVVVGIGGVGATHHPPRTVVFANQATGTGALAAAPAQVLTFRADHLEAAHVDGDGVLDLVGATHLGPVLLRRTGANAFSALHSAATYPTHLAAGDLTGDGRVDVFTSFDDTASLHPGSADTTFEVAVDPTVTYLNATHSAAMTASVRNAPVVPELAWTASRGAFGADGRQPHEYTAPATAAPGGTPVTVTATLAGTTSTATRALTVVNDRYTFTSLGGQDVRQLATDPGAPGTLYAATATGVYRSTSGGATFALLGATTATGTDAREVTVARDPGTGAPSVVARFATGIWRHDGTAWTDADGGAFAAAAVEALPGTPTVYAAATTGSVWRSADGGQTWSDVGGTLVTDVVPVDADTFWAVRSAAPRVSVGTVGGGTAAYAARETPQPAAAVQALAVDPDDRTRAWVATSESNGHRLFHGGTGGAWTSSPVPTVVNRLAVAPDGAVAALDDDSVHAYKSLDGGASWYSVYRGFTVNPTTVAFRPDSLTLVGSKGGLYTPLDLVAPAAPEVTGGPSGTTGPGTAGSFVFTFTGAGASYLCALDGTAWAACASGKSYSGPLAEGIHTFAVVAVDENGNESPPATRTWTVDATPPPVPEITSGPSGTVRSTSATFEFTLGGDAAGAVCSRDGAAAVACTSPHTYTGLSEAPHTFAVRSVDAYGNQSAAATRTWTPDVTPPAYPYFLQQPSYYWTTSSAYFAWQSDSTATYACALDGQPLTCASKSGHSLSGLTQGVHTFRVSASDAAGNTISNTHQWTVDLTPPEQPVITAYPPAETSATSATFTFATVSTEGLAGYYCALDGAAPQWCWESVAYTGLAAGPHTFSVYAYDQGYRSSPTATYTWSVVADPPPPTPTITGGPSGLVSSRTAAFTYTVAPGLAAKCSLNGAEPSSCPSTGTTYTGLADGAYTFAVYAVSGTGVLSAPATRAWTVDGTPPAAPVLTATPAARTNVTAAAFDWAGVAGESYTCALDGVTVVCADDASFTGAVAEGAHTFAVTARDAAGNYSGTTTYAWTVDTTGPLPVFDTTPPLKTKETVAAFTFHTDAADFDRFTCTLDAEPVACADGSVTLTVPSPPSSTYTFRVTAVDDLGNAASAEHEWFVDTAEPSVSISATTASLTAARVVRFDQPAYGVGPATVKLLTGTTSVGVTVVCRDHANVPLSCASTNVRDALVTPVRPLVLGQRYVLRVAGVTDDVGNVVEPTQWSFRASTSEQETTAGAAVAWRKVSSSAAQGGSYTVSDVKGATATYAFTGTSVTFYGIRGRSFGKADLFVDGEPKPRATVNYYASATGRLGTTVSGLANAKHTLKVVVRGEKGSASGTGTAVAVDAVKVGSGTVATSPVFRHAWARRAATGASGGAYALEDNAGASYTVTFRGTAFTWVTALGPSMGKATVKIDSGAPVTVDNYAAATRYGYARRFGGLADRVHTVRVTVLGQRRAGATGAYVVVDRFGIT